MAMATQHPYAASSSSDLNNHASAPQQYANGNGKHRHAYYRPAEDDDSIATEQFPEFDPSHDGSEEDENHAPHYTHSTAMNGKPETKQQSNAHRHDEQDEDENDDDDTRSLSPVEPLPEPPHDDDGNSIHTQQTTPVMTSPVNSPPYWAHGNHQSFQSRTAQDSNNLSTESLVPRGGITLQDNEAEEDGASAQQAARDSEETRTSYGRDRNKACWARSVEVTNYVIVNGSTTNIGAFVVWNIRVQTLSGPYMNIRKRYSEFDDFRHALIRTFPNFEAAVPVLPPKSVISRFRPRFLEKRRAGLQYFLNCILLNPEFSGSPVLKDFLFS